MIVLLPCRSRFETTSINNIHLLRGMLGRPGAGVLQMNGQPTAQNTREAGADGDLPGMRNWANQAHIDELAGLWNIDPMTIPHWAAPTHAMQIFRYAEQGSIKFLWISATNPAVSLPDLPRTRKILDKDDLFLVVQDLFLTETARLPPSSSRRPRGARRPGRSPMRTAPSTYRRRLSIRPATPAPTWRSSSITPAGWTSRMPQGNR